MLSYIAQALIRRMCTITSYRWLCARTFSRLLKVSGFLAIPGAAYSIEHHDVPRRVAEESAKVEAFVTDRYDFWRNAFAVATRTDPPWVKRVATKLVASLPTVPTIRFTIPTTRAILARVITPTTLILTLVAGTFMYQNRAAIGKLIEPRVRTMRDTFLAGTRRAYSKAKRNLLRTTFQREEIAPVRAIANHAHGACAAQRREANKFMQRVAAACGMKTHAISASEREMGIFDSYSRAWYTPADLQLDPKADVGPPEAVVMLTDVDYHVDDLPAQILADGRPFMMYSIMPTKAADSQNEYAFRFKEDGNILWEVTGQSATYEHKLWEWHKDIVTISGTIVDALLNRNTYGAYRIETRAMRDHKVIVLVVPICVWTGWTGWLASWFADSPLERFNPVMTTSDGEKWARFWVHQNQQERYLTAAQMGTFDSVEITAQLDASYTGKATCTGLDVATIRSLRDKLTGDDGMAMSYPIQAYYKAKCGPAIATVYPVEYGVRRYHTNPKNYTGDERPSLVPFMAPLLHGAFAPDKCRDNDETAVRGRVTKFKAEDKITPYISSCIDDFIEHFPSRVVLPVDYDVVRENQPRPSQRGALERGSGMPWTFKPSSGCCFAAIEQNGDTTTGGLEIRYRCRIYTLPDCMHTQGLEEAADEPVQLGGTTWLAHEVSYEDYKSFVDSGRESTFVKAEALNQPKDPRIITTINPAVKLCYSMFCLSAAGLFKLHKWYAFGKHPSDIADTVANICAKALWVVPSDFSRFDGHKGNVVHELERRWWIRVTHPEYVAEVLSLHDHHVNRKAVTSNGVKYDTATTRLSGGADTSMMNTLANAFIAYYALRCEGVEKQEAWNHLSNLGIYGGDDGLTANIDPEQYVAAAKRCNMELEIERIEKGERGVHFLARYYSPNVWYGDTNSMCDIRRQLAKFHTTTRLPPNVTAIDKLYAKSLSFMFTDAQTPVIGPFVRTVVELCKGRELLKEASCLINYNVRQFIDHWSPEHSVCVNEYADWMDTELELSIPDIRPDTFDDWLSQIREITQMLEPPLLSDPPTPEVKMPMVVDGDIVEPPPAPAAPDGRGDAAKPPTPAVDNKGGKRKRKSKGKGKQSANAG